MIWGNINYILIDYKEFVMFEYCLYGFYCYCVLLMLYILGGSEYNFINIIYFKLISRIEN